MEKFVPLSEGVTLRVETKFDHRGIVVLDRVTIAGMDNTEGRPFCLVLFGRAAQTLLETLLSATEIKEVVP